MTARRRRGLLLLSLALASGGLAASEVRDRERSVEARVGPLVPVLVAGRDLEADARLGPGAVALREVPARFAPPDALSGPAALAGARTAMPVPEGSYLTAGQLQGASRDRVGRGTRVGERALEVTASGGQALLQAAPGARVDVLVSSEPRAAGGRTVVALEDVELMALRGSDSTVAVAPAGEDDGAPATAVATLRVTLEQAVYLTAAENFAREIRLLVRPPGDRARAGRVGVGTGQL